MLVNLISVQLFVFSVLVEHVFRIVWLYSIAMK